MIIKDNKEYFLDYCSDASNFHGEPEKLYIPENLNELIDLIKECNDVKIPITISGGRTGLTGASVAIDGILVSTEKFNSINLTELNNGYVTVGSGVRLCELESSLASTGYYLPPNPTEKNATFGGMISTNASGSRSYLYGSIRNYVERIQLVTANHKVITLNRNDNSNDLKIISEFGLNDIFLNERVKPEIKNSAGYYLGNEQKLIDLIIGSEGTLGVITEIKLKLDKLPEDILSMLLFFDDEDALLDYLSELQENRNKFKNSGDKRSIFCPRMIEYFDKESLNIITSADKSIPSGKKAALWIEIETITEDYDYHMHQLTELLENYNISFNDIIVANSISDKNKFEELRHLLPAKINEIVINNGLRKIGSDVAVPRDEFKYYYKYVQSNFINSGIKYAIWGHIGDCHLHANFIPSNDYEMIKSKELMNDVVIKALSLGGTFSAEHGVGKTKKKYLNLMYSVEQINYMKSIKSKFDKNNIFGRGNIFDL